VTATSNQPQIYRVEITTSCPNPGEPLRLYNDCYRECGALSAAEFMLERLPANMLPARIVATPAQQIIRERQP
jgi:hypothetical protein